MSVDGASLHALKTQLQNLIERHARGELSTPAFEAQRQQVEQAMVTQVMQQSSHAAHTGHASAPGLEAGGPTVRAHGTAPDAQTAPRPRVSLRLAAASAAFTLAIAMAGYAWKGSPALLDTQALAARQAVEQAAASASGAAAAGAEPAVTPEQFAALVEKLAQRMQSEPDNAEGWTMLARAYGVLGRSGDAVASYARAVALRPDSAALLVDYADALGVTQGNSLEGEPARLIDRALTLSPDEPKALALAGALAFDRKDFAGATARWQRVLDRHPDHPLAPQLQQSIAQAQQAAAGGAPATASPAPLPSNAVPSPSNAAPAIAATTPSSTAPATSGAKSMASVSGIASIDPVLAARAQPDHTVFVFARAAVGSRMPLAVVRKTVKDLPFAFTLDDGNAMSQEVPLSAAGTVVVGVRISASGNATPQPGDLQGSSAPVPVGATGVDVVAREVVR